MKQSTKGLIKFGKLESLKFYIMHLRKIKFLRNYTVRNVLTLLNPCVLNIYHQTVLKAHEINVHEVQAGKLFKFNSRGKLNEEFKDKKLDILWLTVK